MPQDHLELKGKIIVTGSLKALTGLRIGAASSGLEIGGVDNLVIRDALTGKPYVPGSSLKGKMRSLLTKGLGKRIQVLVAGRRGAPDIKIHWCETEEEYRRGGSPCALCRTFGVAGERSVEPTRLIVRDGVLLEELEVTDDDGNTQRRRWQDVTTDLPYTEVKWEAVIDVLTAAANPRQMERVPAGALFEVEMLFSVYDNHDRECLRTLLLGMRLLEDDYLGSCGSRGYGKVAFRNLRLFWRALDHYKDPEAVKSVELNGAWGTPADLLGHFDSIAQEVWGGSAKRH